MSDSEEVLQVLKDIRDELRKLNSKEPSSESPVIGISEPVPQPKTRRPGRS